MGNPSAFVALLLALTYRYNSAPAGIAIALKLYLWPVLLWSGLGRGWRDLMIGVMCALAADSSHGRSSGSTVSAATSRWLARSRCDLDRPHAMLSPTWGHPRDARGARRRCGCGEPTRPDRSRSQSWRCSRRRPCSGGSTSPPCSCRSAIQRPRSRIAWLIPFLAIGVHGDAYIVTMSDVARLVRNRRRRRFASACPAHFCARYVASADCAACGGCHDPGAPDRRRAQLRLG